MLHLPGSLEPQLRLSVAPCEMAPVISSVAAQFYRRSKRGSGWQVRKAKDSINGREKLKTEIGGAKRKWAPV
jgi:hypothetical protein